MSCSTQLESQATLLLQGKLLDEIRAETSSIKEMILRYSEVAHEVSLIEAELDVSGDLFEATWRKVDEAGASHPLLNLAGATGMLFVHLTAERHTFQTLHRLKKGSDKAFLFRLLICGIGQIGSAAGLLCSVFFMIFAFTNPTGNFPEYSNLQIMSIGILGFITMGVFYYLSRRLLIPAKLRPYSANEFELISLRPASTGT